MYLDGCTMGQLIMNSCSMGDLLEAEGFNGLPSSTNPAPGQTGYKYNRVKQSPVHSNPFKPIQF